MTQDRSTRPQDTKFQLTGDEVEDSPVWLSEGAGARNELRTLTVTSICMVILAAMASLVMLYFGRVILIPVAAAVMIGLVLHPMQQRLKRLGLPAPLSGLFLVALISSTVMATMYALSGPAKQWVLEVPNSLHLLQNSIGEFKQPIEQMRKATEQVEEMGDMGGKHATEVVVQADNLPSQMVVQLREAAVGIFITLVVLFFVLGWGNRLYRNLISALPRFVDRRKTVSIVHEIEASISAYLGIITVINMGLGCVVAFSLYLLDMPNPLLWGVTAAILNYIPYLGPMLTAGILALASLTAFPTISEAAVIPGVFIVITIIEGYVITPMAVGSRLIFNPLVIFVSLIFWFWIWGIIGGLLTVPFLICFKIIAEHVFGKNVSGILD